MQRRAEYDDIAQMRNPKIVPRYPKKNIPLINTHTTAVGQVMAHISLKLRLTRPVRGFKATLMNALARFHPLPPLRPRGVDKVPGIGRLSTT